MTATPSHSAPPRRAALADSTRPWPYPSALTTTIICAGATRSRSSATLAVIASTSTTSSARAVQGELMTVPMVALGPGSPPRRAEQRPARVGDGGGDLRGGGRAPGTREDGRCGVPPRADRPGIVRVEPARQQRAAQACQHV